MKDKPEALVNVFLKSVCGLKLNLYFLGITDNT